MPPTWMQIQANGFKQRPTDLRVEIYMQCLSLTPCVQSQGKLLPVFLPTTRVMGFPPPQMAFPVLHGDLPDGKRSMTGWLSTWRVALPPLRVKRTTWYLPSFTVTAGSSMVMSSVPTLKITPTFPCSCVRMDNLFIGGE